MKKFNFFAMAASIFLLAACGEQTQENQGNEAPETLQESPSDVYNEGEVLEEDETLEEESVEEDPTLDINADREGGDLGVDTEEVDVNVDTRETEEMENAEDDTVVVE